MNEDDQRRSKLLRRDMELARLISELTAIDEAKIAEDVVLWALAREAERRGLADEALDRYRELNLLYNLAERSASLDPDSILGVAIAEISRVSRRGTSAALLIDDAVGRLLPVDAQSNVPGMPADGFELGAGIIGSVAAAGDGEIVNDPRSDPRATDTEITLGALMIAPLRAGERRLGVLLIAEGSGAEFTAGEHRMLSAVAALTAPALDAALTHQKTVAHARAREAELERQLETLRIAVESSRVEERVSEITGTEYFQTLRRQAAGMRESLKSGPRKSER